jgi:hypothetical protein
VALVSVAFDLHGIAELVQQLDQLVGAAVHVADDVERPAHVAPVRVGCLGIGAHA